MEEIEIDHSIFYISRLLYTSADNLFRLDIFNNQKKYIGELSFNIFNGCRWKIASSTQATGSLQQICDHVQRTVPDPFREYGVSVK